MRRWCRAWYQPCMPLGKDGRRVTGSEEHIQLSRMAAREGMVLLKNQEQVLPLEEGTRLALFGKGTVDYVKGGGGSGDVTAAYTRSLYEGLKQKADRIQILEPLARFYQEEVGKQYRQGITPGCTTEPEIPEDLLKQAEAFTDTAVISICRFSGEAYDRKGEPGDGDFYLTREEQKMVDTVTARFSRVIVVLNVGGMVDTSWFCTNDRIASVLLAWQGGIEGGLAAADLLCGDATPSGKLTDTFAGSFQDYPSSAGFHESEDYVEYTEDIYVGYRYFETIPQAAEKVNYPFGYGLSYTTFERSCMDVREEAGTVRCKVQVTNTGNYPGKEVVQLYYSAPQGLLGKPARELGAFAKTRLLQPGESQQLMLEMSVSDMASYDDLGAVCRSAYILEQGTYGFYLGGSVREAEKLSFAYELPETRVVARYTQKAAPTQLKKRLLADGTYQDMPSCPGKEREMGLEPQDIDTLEGMLPEIPGRPQVQLDTPAPEGWITLEDVAEGTVSLDTFVENLTDEELASLLGGQENTGVANTFGMGNLPSRRIPNIMTADGPAGLRIQPECGVCTTSWPCATLLACSWNPDLAYQVGAAGAEEVKENNIGIWLTPAMNIHRSPLCGRNFEYYSEDPLVAGKIGAALIRGIQSRHIGASMKHFACNNKETNRKDSDSRVSERALREIYLKGFEIAVKEAQPWTIMTSYNKVNGWFASENQDLLTGILREEWGFTGMVTTDWWNHGEHYLEVKAGNDVKMGCGYPRRLLEARGKGLLSRQELEACGRRVLEMILKID